MSLARVKKRDGRFVPFEKQKIAQAVERAQAAVGESDAGFAGEVADVVELALRRRHPDERSGSASESALPSIEEIQDLVEQALIELGRAAVAKAYILYRDRRARLRAVLQVRADTPRTRAPRVQVSSGVESWSKGRIVAALMNEADLPRATAAEIAARVEERVFDSGLVRLSSALIRELVDNELVERGLSQALRRQRPVGLPRHDLRRILDEPEASSAEGTTRGAVETIGAEILRRYALDDVLTEPLAEMHLSGDLALENVAAPHLALTRALPCELFLCGEPSPRAAFELLDEIVARAAEVSQRVVLEDVPAVLQGLHRSPRPSRSISNWLLSLSAAARASGRRIDLALASSGPLVRAASTHGVHSDEASPVGAHAPAWLARLFEDLHELVRTSPSFRAPCVFVDGEDLVRLSKDTPAVRADIDPLLASGTLVPTWGAPDERFVGPGLVRLHGERGLLTCFGAVALNMPRAARRAGPWREDQLFEELARLVESALDIAVLLRDFQRAHRGAVRGSAGRACFAITPIGLCEALRWLADGELQPEQGGRVLAFLVEAAQRFGAVRGLSVVLTPYFGDSARARFAELDAGLFPLEQPLLFDGLGETASPRGEPYSAGFDMTRARGALNPSALGASALGAGAAFFLASQRSGALHPAASLGAPAQGDLSALDAWVRLERLRHRLRSGGHPLYALPNAGRYADVRAEERLPYDDVPTPALASVAALAHPPVDHEDVEAR